MGRPKVIGHNRPRKFVILPGRQLESGRKCRPYEVHAKDNRCVRKAPRKPTPIYRHKDHRYGLQLRHRHRSKSG
ncbi:GL23563 [Drosophila persimilis]|uniref:GL23563 n=2 Tax=Drosophila persimilis TaxID=7234 RepID=B4G2Q1_DROPE|nr:GL23563 [Drosophila persimilis]